MVSPGLAEPCVGRMLPSHTNRLTISWVRPYLSTTDVRGIGTHAGRAYQVCEPGLLHHFFRPGGAHHFHHLVLSEFDQLLVIVMQTKGNLGNRDAEPVLGLGKLYPVLRPRQNFSQQRESRPSGCSPS